MATLTPPTGGTPAVDQVDAVEPALRAPRQAATVVDVPLGRRVMVVSDLLLPPEPTPSSLAITTELAQALESWEGPGLVVLTGDLVVSTDGDGPPEDEPDTAAQRALAAHARLDGALHHFLGETERRVIRQVGPLDPPETTEFEQAGAIDLRLRTTTGSRSVRVEPGTNTKVATGGSTADVSAVTGPAVATGDGAPSRPATDVSPPPPSSRRGASGRIARQRWRELVGRSDTSAWLEGLHRLTDPSAMPRFVTSRMLYRRLGRYTWWLLVPFVVAGLLRLAVTPSLLHHAGNGLPGRTLRQAHQADLTDQLLVAALVAVVVLGVLALVLGLLSRRVWSALGGGPLGTAPAEAAANDAARDAARRLIGQGYAGLITGATFHPELTSMAVGFYANVGASTEVVEERRSRIGLPPVFVHRQRLSWVEIETGADLHVRLLLAQTDLRSPSLLERLVALRRMTRVLHPTVVASYPRGASWPPAPDLRAAHRRARRVRRWSAAAILVAGIVDVLDAVTPPLRHRLHLLLQVFPLVGTEAAGALVALVGLVLIALGRGVLRGQRLAWRVSVVAVTASLVLHLLAGGYVEGSLLALAVLVLLLTNRRNFQAESDWPSLRSAILGLVGGAVGITVLGASSIELFTHVRSDHHVHPVPWPTALWASAQRLVGIQTVSIPVHLNRYLAPTLLAVGLALVAVALFLVSRPVVDRRLVSGRAAELRARDIVRRHGSSTLDYFALRTDKRWFFHRDSLVAYAIYGGICLISPDPIGPSNEREQVWGAFRRFADQHGWVTAIMGAGESWLPIYRDSGMHHVYLGDEALVDVTRFTLAGGHMKGLRQAHNRVARKGYTVSFHDPAHLDRAESDELVSLMGLSRQGEHERGFSMMLGRVFDPRDTGLLLTVVRGPDGNPAAMCQFVPSTGINGFSLDLMRRDPGDHPNGLLDFALCSTIEHLRARDYRGLSLNFAALRSTLDGERGDGTVHRVERWLVKRLSSFGQIESLWRFNAKYEPDWLPRYVVFDTAEHLVPVTMAVLRAESLWEIPVLGKLLAVGAERRMVAAQRDTEAFVASQAETSPPAAEGAPVDSQRDLSTPIA